MQLPLASDGFVRCKDRQHKTGGAGQARAAAAPHGKHVWILPAQRRVPALAWRPIWSVWMRAASPAAFARMLIACTILSACAASPWARDDADHRPEALLDAYLIAHGMAASYAESPGARPGVVLQLQSLDMKAQHSIRDLANPYPANVEATAEAVAALTDYAARQSAQPQ